MALYELLSHTARKHPDRAAVICGEKRFSYAQLEERVDMLSRGLAGIGISEGDRIAVIHRNCHRFMEIYFATARSGAVIVPVNHRLAPDDFIHILHHSRAKVLMAQPDLIQWLFQRQDELPLLERIILTGPIEGDQRSGEQIFYEELLKSAPAEEIHFTDVKEPDMAQIYYTSGTTGRPKGVILSHGNNLVHAEGTIRELSLTGEDRWLHVSPMFHLADAWAVWSMTKVGGTHVFVPGFEPEPVLEAIEKHGVTLSNFIPTMLNILVNYPAVKDRDISSLRLIMSGGAPIAREVVRKVIDIFKCEYIQTYGLTETSPFLTMSILGKEMQALPFEERLVYLVTTGRPFYGVDLRVVNDGGCDVVPDEVDVGEIVVKGDTITPGYLDSPEETSKKIVNGWLHTGDLAVMNPEGYVTIVDRKADMIITGGENVYSIEVEDVLYSHPDIFEAAVIGLPDPVWGEKVTAVVVLREGRKGTERNKGSREAPERGIEGRKGTERGRTSAAPAEDDIIGFCKERLAHFKAPKRVFFVGELPKTGSAKVYKYRLREMFGEK